MIQSKNDTAAIKEILKKNKNSKCDSNGKIFCQIKLSKTTNISIYCDDLMSIVTAFAIYVRENSSRMSCNAKVYKFQKLGFEILETQETLSKKYKLKLKYANNIYTKSRRP